MFAAIRYYRAEPPSVDEVVRRVEQDFVPVIRGMAGFVSYFVLIPSEREEEIVAARSWDHHTLRLELALCPTILSAMRHIWSVHKGVSCVRTWSADAKGRGESAARPERFRYGPRGPGKPGEVYDPSDGADLLRRHAGRSRH